MYLLQQLTCQQCTNTMIRIQQLSSLCTNDAHSCHRQCDEYHCRALFLVHFLPARKITFRRGEAKKNVKKK